LTFAFKGDKLLKSILAHFCKMGIFEYADAEKVKIIKLNFDALSS